jgi:hypothetical protein
MRLYAVAGALSCLIGHPVSAQEGHADLYSIDLVPTPDLRGARGSVRLSWASTPFGVSVSAAGSLRHELIFEIAGLPDPGTLGDYRACVAWATTPLLSPEIKLGEVRNGESRRLGTIEMNQFVVLVSAEASAGVAERAGRLALRGASPSSQVQPTITL